MKPVAIVLNGASSSGKTSIAKAIQALARSPVLYASVDTFLGFFHWPAIRDQQDDLVTKECRTLNVSNFHACLTILASSRFAVVVDHVIIEPELFASCREALKAKETYFIGVRCPVEVLAVRELIRGNRKLGLARQQIERVHEKKTYDFEVDTSTQPPESCAQAILEFVTNAKKG